jgi:hypothetical protein
MRILEHQSGFGNGLERLQLTSLGNASIVVDRAAMSFFIYTTSKMRQRHSIYSKLAVS